MPTRGLLIINTKSIIQGYLGVRQDFIKKTVFHKKICYLIMFKKILSLDFSDEVLK